MALPNRGRLERRLTDLYARMVPNQEHALLYLKVDNRALETSVVKTVSTQVKPGDLVTSLGDGEFAVLLPNCSEAQALQTARLLRIALRRMRFNRVRAVSFNFGIGLVIISWPPPIPSVAVNNARRAGLKAITRGNDSIVTG